MPVSEKVVFLDVPSRPPCRAWSLNTWKTRMLLNYKEIDYETEWVEYLQIKPRLEPYVNPTANGNGSPSYTVPTVKMVDGKYVSESRAIATAIEEIYPEPSVHLDWPHIDKVQELTNAIVFGLVPNFLVKIPQLLLNEASQKYFYETRSASVGMDLEELGKIKGGEQCFDAIEDKLREMTALLKESPEGPFFMGKTVSYADFLWLSLLHMFRRIGGDLLDKVLERSGDPDVHRKMIEAASPYLKRDDH